MTMKFNVEVHYEGVPKFAIHPMLDSLYIEARNEAAVVFNEHISTVNDEWDETGKPASFGRHLEDVNPEYIAFIRERIQPEIDKVIDGSSIGIRIGDTGDLEGYIRDFPKSKIYATLYEMK